MWETFVKQLTEALEKVDKWTFMLSFQNVSQYSCCINGPATGGTAVPSQTGKLSLQLLD